MIKDIYLSGILLVNTDKIHPEDGQYSVLPDRIVIGGAFDGRSKWYLQIIHLDGLRLCATVGYYKGNQLKNIPLP